MTPVRTTRSTALLAALFVSLAAAGGPAAAEVTVKGDAAAWHDVVAAYRKLGGLSGYRMKTTMPQGGMVVEVAPPSNAMHSTVQTTNGDVEFVMVAGQSRMRTTMPGAPAGWRCVNVPQAQTVNMHNPSAFQGTVDVARGPDAAIDGQPVHVYVYTMEGASGPLAGTAIKNTLYVGGDNGLPRRVVIATPRGDQTVDYYDYGAPIQITLPACT